eukprot:3940654-Rhodomonas_salina.3
MSRSTIREASTGYRVGRYQHTLAQYWTLCWQRSASYSSVPIAAYARPVSDIAWHVRRQIRASRLLVPVIAQGHT